MKLKHYCFLLCIPLLSACYHSEKIPIAHKGVIDLRNWDFEKNKNIELNGEWEFYWNKMPSPEQFATDSVVLDNMEYVKVPDIWSKRETNSRPSNGFASHNFV